MRITDADADKAVSLIVAQEFSVSLPIQPGTGYTWRLSTRSTGAVMFVRSAVESTPGLPFSSEVQTLEFRVLRSGQSELIVVYVQSWENERFASRSFRVQLKIAEEPRDAGTRR